MTSSKVSTPRVEAGLRMVEESALAYFGLLYNRALDREDFLAHPDQGDLRETHRPKSRSTSTYRDFTIGTSFRDTRARFWDGNTGREGSVP